MKYPTWEGSDEICPCFGFSATAAEHCSIPARCQGKGAITNHLTSSGRERSETFTRCIPRDLRACPSVWISTTTVDSSNYALLYLFRHVSTLSLGRCLLTWHVFLVSPFEMSYETTASLIICRSSPPQWGGSVLRRMLKKVQVGMRVIYVGG